MSSILAVSAELWSLSVAAALLGISFEVWSDEKLNSEIEKELAGESKT